MKGYHITSNLGDKNKAAKKARKEKNENANNKQELVEVQSDLSLMKSTPLVANVGEGRYLNEIPQLEKLETEIILETKIGTQEKKKIEPLKRNKMKTVKEDTLTNNADRKKMTIQRKTALVNGWSLIFMAVLAGLAIPSLGTLTASICLIGIFILDAVVSICMLKYHKKEQPKLSKLTSLFRLIYTAILGVAIGHHIAGSVAMFNHIWGIGLIAFGVHLICLGFLYNNEGGKKWVNILIKSLLIAAGVGYLIQYIGILVVANPLAFAALIEPVFILPMILGEVLYALWMIVKGGKSINE